jgi:hypothetical protein
MDFGGRLQLEVVYRDGTNHESFDWTQWTGNCL